LFSIPEVCKDCYTKAMDAVGPIYKQQIERQCKKDYMEANSVWATNQNYYGAEQASSFLAKIDPNSSCYLEAKALNDKISKRIKEIDNKEWAFQLKQQQDEVDIKKAEIKSARDIGVAYGQNQPKTVIKYNISSWWW
jgi:divalent metal cation (Fe/Co/Zn/Cd) transporter